jgi:hypothetical protein
MIAISATFLASRFGSDTYAYSPWSALRKVLYAPILTPIIGGGARSGAAP